MGWLRLLLVAGCLGAAVLSAATALWEARLVQGNQSWIMDLGRHPTWRPPPAPAYEVFRQHFERSKDFPRPNDGWTIQSGYDRSGVGLAGVAYCWPVAGACGLLYLTLRGTRRDLALHCALHFAAGLAAAAVACVALWCVAGGWGPPAVGCFGACGVIGGITTGLVTFLPSDSAPDAPVDVGAGPVSGTS